MTIDALAKVENGLQTKKAQLENDVEEGKAVEVTAPVFNEVPAKEMPRHLDKHCTRASFQAYVRRRKIKSEINWCFS